MEFLIFAPLVAALMYFSHDLNFKLSNKQDVYLANQAMFEAHLSDENQLKDFGKTAFQKMGGKGQIQIFLEEQKPDDPKLLTRLSNNKLVGENDSSVFSAYQSLQQSQLQQSTNYLTQIGPTVVSALPNIQQNIVQMTTLCTSEGEEGMFAASTHHLLSIFGQSEQVPVVSSGEAAQLFFQKSSSYHADWLGDWSLLGELLALNVENNYGIAGPLDLEEAHFQTYCMSNLGASSVCGEIEFLWMDNPSDFVSYAYNLAQNKMALYDLLAAADMDTIQTSLQAIGGNLPIMQNTFLDEAHTNKLIGESNQQQLEAAINFLHLKDDLAVPNAGLSQGLQSRLDLKEVLP